MFPVIQLGKLSIQSPSLMIILGLYLGISLAEHFLAGKQITVNQFYSIIFIGLGLSLVGARLFFFFENMPLFFSSPQNLFSLDVNLLDPFAGVALGAISIIIFGYRKKLHFWNTLDAFTPMMAVFAIFLGLAHLASGKAFGIPTSLPWGINLWGESRHPSQLYEIIASSIVLLFFWRWFNSQDIPGKTFLLFISTTAGVNLFLGMWRGDRMPMIGGVRLSQLIAWLVLVLALFLLDKRMAVRNYTGKYRSDG